MIAKTFSYHLNEITITMVNPHMLTEFFPEGFLNEDKLEEVPFLTRRKQYNNRRFVQLLATWLQWRTKHWKILWLLFSFKSVVCALKNFAKLFLDTLL